MSRTYKNPESLVDLGSVMNEKKSSMANCREPTAQASDGLCVFNTLLRVAKERSRKSYR